MIGLKQNLRSRFVVFYTLSLAVAIGIILLVAALLLQQERVTVPPKIWGGLYLAIFIMLIAIALSADFLVQRILHPLTEITAAARRIAQGDWKSEIYYRHQDELGELAAAINELSRSMSENIRSLAENKGQLEAILANMESGVILFDQGGRINLLNPAAERILSVVEKEVKGKSHVEAIKNFSLSQLVDEVLRNWKPVHGEISLFFPQERILDMHAAPVFGEHQKPNGLVVVLHDISEIRRLERVRAEFVANVSHELKTPVTAVKGFAETLLSGALYNYRAAEEFVSIINDEADRLSRLIHDLLELSRIESKEAKLRLETIDLTAEIRETVDRLKPQFQKHSLALTTELPSAPVTVRADRDQLEQVFLNLLDNALKYTPAGGSVSVGLKEQIEEVLVTVKDTGIGIPHQDLSRIFERFYRVDKARSRKLGGTGLGLAIVKHIVEAHQGHVWVKSTPGKGTCFYFTIPRATMKPDLTKERRA